MEDWLETFGDLLIRKVQGQLLNSLVALSIQNHNGGVRGFTEGAVLELRHVGRQGFAFPFRE